MPFARLDLTRPRAGRRIVRAVSVDTTVHGATLTVHIGDCRMAADMSLAQLQQLRSLLDHAAWTLAMASLPLAFTDDADLQVPA